MRIVTRIRAFAVAVLMVLTGLVATASPASAHHPIVSGTAVCNQETGLFDITWTIGNSETNKDMTYTTDRGFSGSVAGGAAPAVHVEPNKEPGTYGIRVDASWVNGPQNVKRHFQFNVGGTCEKPDVKVTAAAFSVTPPTCDTDGQGTIPQQPEGVSVTPAPGTYGVGTETVTFTAEDGYVLTSDPSGTMTVEAATGYQGTNPDAPCYEEPEPNTEPKSDRRVDCTGVERRTWRVDSDTGEVVAGSDSGWVKVRDLTRQEKINRGCIEVEGEEEETPKPGPSPKPSPAPRVVSGVPTAVDAGI